MLVGHHHLSSAARSDDGNIELALRLRIGISPHLNKWSHLPPYSEYHYENIKDVVSPGPTVRHRTILHSVIGPTATTTSRGLF